MNTPSDVVSFFKNKKNKKKQNKNMKSRKMKKETRCKIQKVYSPNLSITLGMCFGVKVAIHSLTHHKAVNQSSTLMRLAIALSVSVC